MNLIKFKRDSDIINDAFKTFFDSPFFRGDVYDASSFTPRTRITEDKDNFYINLEMPGIPKENVKIEVENNMLSVKGEKKSQTKSEEHNLIMNEIVYGEFCRTFTLSKDIKVDDISAEFKDGMLNVTLPKVEEAKPVVKQIEVK
ncbi:MAG: Hsp20/alpha crystallin family protein [Ignavibacteria bacterium]|jgi:HSP20 family protein|nr:Hsp20/alpha crystallin family protein [Ignavibacteria bacterium]